MLADMYHKLSGKTSMSLPLVLRVWQVSKLGALCMFFFNLHQLFATFCTKFLNGYMKMTLTSGQVVTCESRSY